MPLSSAYSVLRDYSHIGLANWSSLDTVQLAIAVPLIYILGKITCIVAYRLALSPLSQFPGPTLAALSEWWDLYHVIKCDRFKVIQHLHEKHGPVVRVGPNHLSFSSPTIFQHVYVKSCSKFPKADFYASIQPGVGKKYSGLFNYTSHQRAMAERRDVQPILSPTNLKEYEERFEDQLRVLVSKMQTRDEIDLFAYFKFLLLDAISEISFNESFNQLDSGEEHQYVVDFNNAFMLIGLVTIHLRMVDPFIPYLPLPIIKDAYSGHQRIFKYAQERVEAYLKSNEEKRGTLLRGFLDPETGQPRKEYSPWTIAIAGHGFIVAGSEASSITLTYIIWLLIKYPEMEHRLRDELATLPANYKGSDLAALPFLDAVIKETLRVYPPSPSAMPRVVPSEGFELQGRHCPPGTIIAAQPYTIHRDRELFEDPEAFRPERWLEASPEKKDRMNKAFVPFSAGQRGCIGRGLAWLHMTLTIAKCLENFDRFELTNGMQDDDMELIERGALAKPKGTKLWVKYHVKASPRFQ